MDESGLRIWLKKAWSFWPGGLPKERSFLIWDMFKPHLVDDIAAEYRSQNTDIVVILGGLTNLVQPLDVSINKPFKDNMR